MDSKMTDQEIISNSLHRLARESTSMMSELEARLQSMLLAEQALMAAIKRTDINREVKDGSNSKDS